MKVCVIPITLIQNPGQFEFLNFPFAIYDIIVWGGNFKMSILKGGVEGGDVWSELW